MTKHINKIIIIFLVLLFAGGFTTLQSNEVSEGPIFVSNSSLSTISGGDCEGSCVGAELWQYCVAYSEIRWEQRNRTAEEAEECEEEDEEVGEIP